MSLFFFSAYNIYQKIFCGYDLQEKETVSNTISFLINYEIVVILNNK